MAKLTIVLGSVTKPGRMNAALQCMADAPEAAALFDCDLVDLGAHRVAFADGRPPEQYGDDTAQVVARVAGADAVVLASPVYRGTFTGALKNLLDHLPVEALAGKPVGIVAMGATQHHYLGVDWHLRDVLAWFGALVAPTGVYLASSDFSEGRPSAGAQAELLGLVQALAKLRALAPAAGEWLGPKPLAARRG
jgi:FMN reductase